MKTSSRNMSALIAIAASSGLMFSPSAQAQTVYDASQLAKVAAESLSAATKTRAVCEERLDTWIAAFGRWNTPSKDDGALYPSQVYFYPSVAYTSYANAQAYKIYGASATEARQVLEAFKPLFAQAGRAACARLSGTTTPAVTTTTPTASNGNGAPDWSGSLAKLDELARRAADSLGDKYARNGYTKCMATAKSWKDWYLALPTVTVKLGLETRYTKNIATGMNDEFPRYRIEGNAAEGIKKFAATFYDYANLRGCRQDMGGSTVNNNSNNNSGNTTTTTNNHTTNNNTNTNGGTPNVNNGNNGASGGNAQCQAEMATTTRQITEKLNELAKLETELNAKLIQGRCFENWINSCQYTWNSYQNRMGNAKLRLNELNQRLETQKQKCK